MSAGDLVQGPIDLANAYGALEASFDQAASRTAVVECTLRVDQQLIQLEFAGPAMVGVVMPALEHLTCTAPAREPDLTIKVWDTASTGTRLPELSELHPQLGSAIRHPQYIDGPVRLSFRVWESTVSVMDAARGEALYCVADAARVAPYDVAYPLKELFQWWMAGVGLQLVHSAAVGTRGGGVLLPGASGSGKSTVALACLQAGMRFAGDDYVLVADDPPAARCLYSSGRADAALVRRHGSLLPRLEPPSQDSKAVAFFRGPALAAQLALRAIVLPRVVPGGRSRLSPERPAAALLALAPATVLQLRGAGLAALSTIRRLNASVTTYSLLVGDDLERIPGLLTELIDTSPRCS